jgi:hypothetical protein
MADKALFEQTLQNDPEYMGSFASHRFAFGKAGTATVNITLAAFKTWLRSALTGWLEESQNLADLPNKGTARNNLQVYSKNETYSSTNIDGFINGVLGKLGGLTVGLVCGVESDGTIHQYGGTLSATCVRDGALVYTITHNAGTSSYLVSVIRKVEEYYQGMSWHNNDFTIAFNDSSLGKHAQEFYFILYLLA